jgi:hypothetical protein
MQKAIAKQLPSTLMDKWKALRYTNMLGNFKTPGRNVLGNVAMRGLAEAKNALVTLVEKTSGGKLGKTSSLFVSKDLMDAAKADFEIYKGSIMGENRYSEGSADEFIRGAEDEKGVFVSDNKVVNAIFKPLEAYRKATSWVMNNKYFGDEAFVRSAYKRFFGGYLQANGVTAEQFNDPAWREANSKLVDEARAYATRQAQETTFRDRNAFSDAVSRLGRGKDGAVKTISEGILPFRRTPANVLLRAEQYSPLGFVNAIANATTMAAGKKNANTGEAVTGRDVVESLAKATTGSSLFLLGMVLRSAGILRGSKDDDEKQAAFDELTGAQEYSLVLPGGTSITLDWVSPSSIPLFMGARLEELRREDGLSWADLYDALLSVTDPLLEMSMMSGVNDALDIVRFSKHPLLDFAINSSLGYLTQGLTNTLVGQVSRSFRDESLMNYVDRDSPIPDFLQKALGAASRKYPGNGYNQIPYIDAWGRTESEGDTFAERFANNVFNPAFVSNESKDYVEQELQRVYDSKSGDNNSTVFPTRAEKSIKVNGETKYLTADEYVTYAKRKGQESRALVERAINTTAYKQMSADEKADFISKMYEVANYRAKKAVAPEYEKKELQKYEDAINNGMTPEVYYITKHGGKKSGGGAMPSSAFFPQFKAPEFKF